MTEHPEHLHPPLHNAASDEAAFNNLISTRLASPEDTWRMLHNGPADHELLLSNLDLPARSIALGGLHHASRLLSDIRRGEHDGYSGGLDITPTRVLAGQLARTTAMPQVDGRDLVGGLHQSWAPGPLEMARYGKHRATDLGAWATMPERMASLAVMQRIIGCIGPVATTAYVDSSGRRTTVAFNTYELRPAVQISPDMVRALEPATIPGERDGWWRVLQTHGASGVAIDTMHLAHPSELPANQKPLQLDPDRILQSVEQNAMPVRAIHVAVGRSDAKDLATRRTSQRELIALLNGPDSFAATQAGDIVAKAYGIWRRQLQQPETRPPFVIPVSVEIPYNGLLQALAARNAPRITATDKSRASFIAAHRDITDVLHDFFGRLKAKADHEFAFKK